MEVTRRSIWDYPDRAKTPRPGNGRAVDENGTLCPTLSAVLVMLVVLLDLVDQGRLKLVRDAGGKEGR